MGFVRPARIGGVPLAQQNLRQFAQFASSGRTEKNNLASGQQSGTEWNRPLLEPVINFCEIGIGA